MNFRPREAPEFDDLLVEFKNAAPNSKSAFEGLVASVEHVIPSLKGKLPWAHAVLSSWAATYSPEHTVPMCAGPASLIAAHMSADNHGRLAIGLLLQQALGLRPSELLALEARDIALPEHASFSNACFATIGLGVRENTKAKRAQCVLLRSKTLLALLRYLLHSLESEDPLIGYSYAQYRRILERTCSKIGVSNLHFTPHSPRAGFATELFAQGVPFERIMTLGRWVSPQSLRTYLDVVSASAIAVSLKSGTLTNAMCYCQTHILTFFPGSERFVREPPPSPSDHEGLDRAVGGDLVDARGQGGGTRICTVDAEAVLDASTGQSQVRELGRPTTGRGRGDRRGAMRRASSLKGDSRAEDLRKDPTLGRQVRGRGRGRT